MPTSHRNHPFLMGLWAYICTFGVILSFPAFLRPAPAQEAPVDRTSELPEGVNEAHPLVPALLKAYESRSALQQVKDFEATFLKREVVGRKLLKSTMQVKVRQSPFSVYMKFIEPYAGREVLYVDGQNQGNFLVHEAGFKSLAGTFSFAPRSPDALAENRYPITMMGLHNLIDGVIAQWESEAKYGETEVTYRPRNKLGEVECEVIESSHPQPRKQFKFHLTRLWIESKTNLPVRIEQYDFPTTNSKTPVLTEEYTYVRIRPNIGLTNRDFDKSNRNYAFP